MAAPRPMAETIGGVPASNLHGRSPGSKRSKQHAADHAPAAQEGRHGLQQFPLAIEHADARRAQHLVAAEDEEIDVQGLHVGLLVRHALGPIHQHQGAGLVPAANDFGHGVDRAQYVGYRRNGDEFGPLGEQRVERVQAKQAVVGEGNVPQHRAAALGKLLPGDEVRVMLHLGEQDLIARLDVRIAPTPRDGVDARGCPIGKDALLALRGVDERADRLPGLVEQLVRLLGQLVNAAMHVGVMLFVATDDRLDDLAGMLRAGRVVEVDQRHAGADLAAEDGEIRAAGQGVQRRGLHERAHELPAFPAWDGSAPPFSTGE